MFNFRSMKITFFKETIPRILKVWRLQLESKSIMSSTSLVTASDSEAIDNSGKVDALDKNSSMTLDNGNCRKRQNSGSEETESKRPTLSSSDMEENSLRKKKVAILLAYCGKGYLGMQRNPGFKTIESDLHEALVKAGLVRPDHIEQPGVKMGFQRAARTDKGVSAAAQVVSLKMFVDVEEPLVKINQHLPPEIRVLGLKRTTKGFDAKNSCNSRTYSYIMPTYTFAASHEDNPCGYRITETVLAQLQEILSKFEGSHNFHNFTSGKKFDDPSARRYIMKFQVGKPFEKAGIEYVVLTVQGQSFMLHQIRKMIGLAVAICRGFVLMDVIDKSWKSEKMDVPKVPGLGLILESLHYDGYNRKFGNDGVHAAIKWDECVGEINDFKEKFIYPVIFSDTEGEDGSMLQWLSTLQKHNFDQNKDQESNSNPDLATSSTS